jgi:hypothetical protein
MFVNFSNHPSAKWSKEQADAALALGGGIVVDVPFPVVPPTATCEDVLDLASLQVNAILELDTPARPVTHPLIVLVQGEMTLTFRVVTMLRIAETVSRVPHSHRCVAACSDRRTVEVVQPDGATKKESVFAFVGFRDYY